MKKISLLCASLCLLVACQTPNATPSSTPNQAQASVASQAAQKMWQLSELAQFAEPQLRHTVMDWRQLPQAHANMGCNSLSFKVNLDNSGSLKVGNILATRMHCPESMALETAFNQQISKMTRYRVENQNTLILENQAGASMKFIAK